MSKSKTNKKFCADNKSDGAHGQTLRKKPIEACVWFHWAKRKSPIYSKSPPKLDRSKLKRRKKSERSEGLRKRNHERRKKRDLAEGRSPGELDWNEIDSNGKPLVSFVPGSKLRKRIKRFLKSASPKSHVRKRIVAKLGEQFARYYTRYRRQAEATSGRGRSPYEMFESERPHAEAVAVNLILKGITPRELLEYWHEHIGGFLSDLSIPPLAFLKSGSAIDQVVCHAPHRPPHSSSKQQRAQPRPTRERARPAGGTSFSDKGPLDVKLRAALEKAGFETQMLNDRYLLSVQYNACSVARGDDVFLSKKMRGMVEWLAENYVEESGLLDEDG